MSTEELKKDQKEKGLKTGESVAIAIQTASNAALSMFDIADAYRKTEEPRLMQIATLLYRGGHQIAHGVNIITNGINNMRVDIEKSDKKEQKTTRETDGVNAT